MYIRISFKLYFVFDVTFKKHLNKSNAYKSWIWAAAEYSGKMKIGLGGLKPENIHLQSLVCSAHSKYTVIPLRPCRWRVILERNKEGERILHPDYVQEWKDHHRNQACPPTCASHLSCHAQKSQSAFNSLLFKVQWGFSWKSLDTLTIDSEAEQILI